MLNIQGYLEGISNNCYASQILHFSYSNRNEGRAQEVNNILTGICMEKHSGAFQHFEWDGALQYCTQISIAIPTNE